MTWMLLVAIIAAIHWTAMLFAWRWAIEEWDRPGPGAKVHACLIFPLCNRGSMHEWWLLLAFRHNTLVFPKSFLPFANSLLWGVVLACPFVIMLHRYRLSRRPYYVCATCGYDMRGNLQASTCPECGARWAVTDTTHAA